MNTDHTDNPLVLVTAATGKTGRRVAARLAADDRPVRALSRSSAARFDWDDPSSWEPVLVGATAVYLVPPESGAERVAPFLDAATTAGVEQVVLLSARAPGQTGDDHLEQVEAAVVDGADRWTILRPSWFMQNFDEGLFADALMAGELALPVGDGREPFIDADDIAAVAVAALTSNAHDGRTYELSGPGLQTFADAVSAIATAGGPAATFADADAQGWVDDRHAEGVPAPIVSALAHLFAAIRAGDNAHLSDGVQLALGRPPTSFDAWAARAYAGSAAPVR